MNDIRALLRVEQKRAIEHLAKHEPGSEEYARCLLAALEMDRWINSTGRIDFDAGTPAPFAVEEPTPAEAPSEEETHPAPTFDVEEYKTALRSRMADARLGGADTKAWLSEVGATKFSAITDPCKLMRLNELVTEFEKEKG